MRSPNVHGWPTGAAWCPQSASGLRCRHHCRVRAHAGAQWHPYPRWRSQAGRQVDPHCQRSPHPNAGRTRSTPAPSSPSRTACRSWSGAEGSSNTTGRSVRKAATSQSNAEAVRPATTSTAQSPPAPPRSPRYAQPAGRYAVPGHATRRLSRSIPGRSPSPRRTARSRRQPAVRDRPRTPCPARDAPSPQSRSLAPTGLFLFLLYLRFLNHEQPIPLELRPCGQDGYP